MEQHLHLKVGLTVVFALLIFALLIFMVSNYHVFQAGKTFFVTFNFANGLAAGAPVMVNGLEVGNVEQLGFTEEEGNVKVRLTVWVNDDARVYANSKAYINTLGLMGEKYLEITSGEGMEQPIAEGAILDGSDPLRQDEMLAIAGDLIREFQRSINAVNAIIAQEGTREDIRDSLHNLKNITTTLDRLLAQNQSNITTILTNFSESSVKLNRSMDSLDRMVTSNEKTLTAAIENFSVASGDLRTAVNDNRQTFNQAMRDLQLFSGDLAALSRGNRDRVTATIANLEASSEKLRQTLDKLNSSSGTLGILLNDPSIGTNLRTSSRDLKEAITYLKRRPWLLFREQDEPINFGTPE